MKDLIYRKKDVLGLDIGTSFVKYVQLKDKGKLTKLIGYGYFEIPKNIIIEGVISEPEKLAKIIKKEISDPPWGKITAERVVASLPESKLFTRILELPSLSDKNIEEAINLEIEQSVPAAITDLYIDWRIVSEEKDKIFVFLAAAPKSIVDSYVQLFDLLSIEPLAFDVSLAAIARAVVLKKSKNEPVILLDIGGQTTNMAIYDDNIQVTGSHPVGAKTLKETLKSVFSIDTKSADALLKIGIKENEKSSEVIKNDLAKVITEVDRIIKYYKDKHKDRNISKILLCGGLGAMTGLDSYIESQTKIKTEVGNPWSNISVYPLKSVPKKDAPMYTAAIGLSLRGLLDE